MSQFLSLSIGQKLKISEFINWSKIEEAYAGIMCIKLAIENSGTAVDEDVEVELQFNNEMLLPVDKFPEIQDEYAIKYLLDKCDLEDLLSIPPTAQYKAYESVTLKICYPFLQQHSIKHTRTLKNSVHI